MTPVHPPSVATITFVFAFAAVYIGVLFRNAVREELDLYDLTILSAAAAVPLGFVLFPGWAERFSQFVGVQFPFIVLFGGLFVCAYVGLYRLLRAFARLNRQVRSLAQELALLSARLDESSTRSRPGDQP